MRAQFLILLLIQVFALTSAFISHRPSSLLHLQHGSGGSSTRINSVNTEDVKKIGGKIVTSKVLQDFVLTDYLGEERRVGDMMGSGKSVVVFLRHLG